MASVGSNDTDRIGRAFMGAFVGFFAGPVLVGPVLLLFWPDLGSHANTGPYLLLSVGVGAACGWILGAAVENILGGGQVDPTDFPEADLWDRDLDS